MCQTVRNEADRQFRRKCQIATGLGLVMFVMCSQGSLRMHRGPVDLALAGLARCGTSSSAHFCCVPSFGRQ